MTATHAQEQAPAAPAARRWPIWLARAGWLLVVLLLTAVFIASIPSANRAERQSWQFAAAVSVVWPTLSTPELSAIVVAARYAVLAVFYAVALLIAARKWDDPFALFVSGALLLVIWGFGARADTSTYVFPGPLARLKPALMALLQIAFLPSWVLLFFLLPDGRFVPRRARWLTLPVLPGALLTLVGNSSLATAIPWRYRSPLAEIGWGTLLIGLLATFIGGLLSQVYRYRRVATPTQRQQMKWILVGLAAQPLPLLFGFAGMDERGAVVALFLPLFVVALLPVTIGLAVLRRRLWDVDPLINRTLVYGGLTLLVLALYVALVGLAFVFFGGASNLFLAALAVGVAALLAQPLRAGLQRAVNRLMYGDRDDPGTVLARLGDQLATAAAPTEALRQLVASVAQALKLPYVAIESSEAALLAETGRRDASPLSLPLVYQSSPVGRLLVGLRAPGESFSAAERRLLDDIARQAGAAVYAAQLTGHLQRSREQLVLAREEERRRLQRDLHDGLGPQLAALGMQLEVARSLAVDSPDAAALLAKLAAETQHAIADIRRLVYDLRPPALDQLGLVGALREYVAGPREGSGPHVTVEAPSALPPLPAAVEVAAYRIVQEAVANCRRHAAAATCRVTLAVAKSELRVAVEDDGRGLPPAVIPGLGLASMRERAAELGGECRIESTPGRGARVSAAFPLPKGDKP